MNNHKYFRALLVLVAVIAASTLAVAGRDDRRPGKDGKPISAASCQRAPLGNVNLNKTLPGDVCAVIPPHVQGTPVLTRRCDESGNTVVRNWKYVCVDYSNDSLRFVGINPVPGSGSKMTRIILVSEKDSKGNWHPKHELWAKGEYPDAIPISQRASQAYAQNGGGEVVNVAGNKPPPVASTKLPNGQETTVAKQDCSTNPGQPACVKAVLGNVLKGKF